MPDHFLSHAGRALVAQGSVTPNEFIPSASQKPGDDLALLLRVRRRDWAPFWPGTGSREDWRLESETGISSHPEARGILSLRPNEIPRWRSECHIAVRAFRCGARADITHVS
jgi:hypothetical protein